MSDETLQHYVYDLDTADVVGSIDTTHRVRQGEWIEVCDDTGGGAIVCKVDRVVWGNDDAALDLGPDLYIRRKS